MKSIKERLQIAVMKRRRKRKKKRLVGTLYLAHTDREKIGKDNECIYA